MGFRVGKEVGLHVGTTEGRIDTGEVLGNRVTNELVTLNSLLFPLPSSKYGSLALVWYELAIYMAMPANI